MRAVAEVRAVPGRGLEGDRYYERAGTYSNVPEPGRDVTLVEIEALETIEQTCAVALAPGDTRRNIATRGVVLNELVGREFRIGDVTLRGVELCEPCVHMAQVVGKEALRNVLRSLVHRGGLRADVVSEGVVHVGDPVLP
jgi:MOSC domain-containing protein YiiM